MIKKLIIISILALSLFSTTAYAWDDCPFDKVNDEYPGDCARYVDTDNDGICDRSQPAPEDRVTDESNTISEEDINESTSTYHLFPISLFLLFLYAISKILLWKKIISFIAHRKIWNILLLLVFSTTAILSTLLVVRINFDLAIPLPFNILFWHVEFGIAMLVLCILHIIERRSYFLRMLYVK